FQLQDTGNTIFLVHFLRQLEAVGLLKQEFTDDQTPGGIVPGLCDFLCRVMLHLAGNVLLADQGLAYGHRRELVSGFFGIADGDQLHDGCLWVMGTDLKPVPLLETPVITPACGPPDSGGRSTPAERSACVPDG